jgi:ankyrin repeat protein
MTWSRKLTKKAHKAALEACRDGNLDALKVLTGASFDTTDVNSLYYIAAENGHAEVIRWLRTAHINHLQTYILIGILSRAITNAHLNVVQVCVQEEEDGYDEAVRIAIEKGNRKILAWLLSYHINAAIANAAGLGNLEILRWMSTTFSAKKNVSDNDDAALQCAAENGNLDVVKWLVEKSGQKVDATARNNRALGLAAENGHLDVVKWLVFESGQAVVIADQDDYALRKAAVNGHLEVVKFLVNDSNQVCGAMLDWDEVLWSVIEAGTNLEMVKWIILDSGQKVDVRALPRQGRFMFADGVHEFLTLVETIIEGGILLPSIRLLPRMIEIIKNDPLMLETFKGLSDDHLRDFDISYKPVSRYGERPRPRMLVVTE